MATIDVPCRFCGQTSSVIKHGKGHSGYPRFRCTDCNRTFQLTYAYKAKDPETVQRTIDMAINGSGIRSTSRVMGIATNTVMKILKNPQNNN